MNSKGFTLIETLLSVFLIGLITLSLLPIFNNLNENTKRDKIRKELIYLSEMTIENIKSYDSSKSTEHTIHGVNLNKIIQSMENENQVLINFSVDTYKIELRKENKSDQLWCLYSKAYYINGDDEFYVEYKAYMPKP